MIKYHITIPNYIRTVILSKKQRPKYWEYDGVQFKSKGKKMLVSLIAKEYKEQYRQTRIAEPFMISNDYYITTKLKGKVIDHQTPSSITGKDIEFLIDAINKGAVVQLTNQFFEPIIANKTQAGKPKNYTINGQDFYSGNLNDFAKRKVIMEIKESFVPYIVSFPVIESGFPYTVDLLLFDVPNPKGVSKWDIGNRSYPYGKAFMDLLCTGITGKKDKSGEYVQYFTPKFPGDDIRFATKTPEGAKFIPITNPDERKLVFVFREDRNNYINNHSFYQL